MRSGQWIGIEGDTLYACEICDTRARHSVNGVEGNVDISYSYQVSLHFTRILATLRQEHALILIKRKQLPPTQSHSWKTSDLPSPLASPSTPSPSPPSCLAPPPPFPVTGPPVTNSAEGLPDQVFDSLHFPTASLPSPRPEGQPGQNACQAGRACRGVSAGGARACVSDRRCLLGEV